MSQSSRLSELESVILALSPERPSSPPHATPPLIPPVTTQSDFAAVPPEWWSHVAHWLKVCACSFFVLKMNRTGSSVSSVTLSITVTVPPQQECTEEISSLRRENQRREENEARLAQHHHTLVSQVADLQKRLHEATATANEAREEARLQRQGHSEVLAFCRESAEGCNTVTRKCMDETRQYVAVQIKAKLESIEALQATHSKQIEHFATQLRSMSQTIETASRDALNVALQGVETKMATKTSELTLALEGHASGLKQLQSADEALKAMIESGQRELESRVENTVKSQLEDSAERERQQMDLGKQMEDMRHKLTDQMVSTADFALQKTLDRLHTAQEESERAAHEARLENERSLKAAIEDLEHMLKAHVRGEVCMVLSATQSELGHTLDHAKLEVDGLAAEVRLTAKELEQRIERIQEEVGNAAITRFDEYETQEGDVGEILRSLRRQHLQKMHVAIPSSGSAAEEEAKEAKPKKARKKMKRSSSVPPKAKKRDPDSLREEALGKEAVALARAVMRVADINKNKELSFTELTCMLENSAYQEFGRWVKEGKQRGFAKYDRDSDGTIDLNELTEFVTDYMRISKHRHSAMAMLQKATTPTKAFSARTHPKNNKQAL